jgi:hypothetical protein
MSDNVFRTKGRNSWRSLTFHFFPRESVEIAGSYLPVVGMDGREEFMGRVDGEGTALINNAEIVWINVYRTQS